MDKSVVRRAQTRRFALWWVVKHPTLQTIGFPVRNGSRGREYGVHLLDHQCGRTYVVWDAAEWELIKRHGTDALSGHDAIRHVQSRRQSHLFIVAKRLYAKFWDMPRRLPDRHLYAVATNRREKASVRLFIIKEVLHNLLPDSSRFREATLLLHGCASAIGVGTNEAFAFKEIHLDHIYERMPDFVPRQGWVVFDVGANIGAFSVQQAQRGARVFAIEPNPDCYHRLSKTVRRNRLWGRITAICCALGAVPGKATLAVGPSTLGGSILPPDGRFIPISEHTVDVETVDDLVGKLGVTGIDLLKIDVEGAEVDVLRGARGTLPSAGRIIVEYHSTKLFRELNDLLLQARFSLVLRAETYRTRDYGNAFYARRPA